MRTLTFVILACAFPLLVAGQEPQRQANARPVQNFGVETAPMPPMAQLPPRTLEPQHVMQEAEQLERMAAELHPQLDRAAAGVMDANLRQKLKDLEKLAKHLRNELEQ